jgi:hypothetical protein
MAGFYDRNQSLMLEPANEAGEDAPRPVERPARKPSYFGAVAIGGALLLTLFWAGAWGAFLEGYFGRNGLLLLPLPQLAIFTAAIVLPPFLFLAIALLIARAHALRKSADALLDASDRLFAIDENTSRAAARLGRAVRREIDGLNSGLDTAFQRLRALETNLQNQIAALDEVGARADVRGEAIAARLSQETQKIENLSDQMAQGAGRAAETIATRLAEEQQRVESLSDRMAGAATRAAETVASGFSEQTRRLEGLADQMADAAAQATESVAGRAAQLKATLENAEGSLKNAAQSLDVQAAGFRAAISAAAEAPYTAAVELDSQAKKIETIADAALARAEFVLARQEKHRAAMNELLGRFKDDSVALEGALNRQRAGMEQALEALGSETKRFELVTGDTERHLELIMANAAARATELTGAFAAEAERLKQASDAANQVLAGMLSALRDASNGAHTLIGESAEQAKHDARVLVGEAMAECEKLLRAAGEMSAQTAQIRSGLGAVISDVEQHIARLPMLAADEAQRVRQLVQQETEQMLDFSARTLSTIHARASQSKAAPAPAQPPRAEPEPEGLKGLARKFTQRQKRDQRADLRGDGKNWDMKQLLEAAESGEPAKRLAPGGAAALGALELALAEMAVDLEAIAMDGAPGSAEWKRYLAGDRAVFARTLAAAIDDAAVDRIAALYREDDRFHQAADAYLSEFESLLARAKEGDGDGLLTSTILSADTGKIYLAIAYALGRL